MNTSRNYGIALLGTVAYFTTGTTVLTWYRSAWMHSPSSTASAASSLQHIPAFAHARPSFERLAASPPRHRALTPAGDCSSTPIDAIPTTGHGLGAHLHLVAAHVGVAWAAGRLPVLRAANSTWLSGNRTAGWVWLDGVPECTRGNIPKVKSSRRRSCSRRRSSSSSTASSSSSSSTASS